MTITARPDRSIHTDDLTAGATYLISRDLHDGTIYHRTGRVLSTSGTHTATIEWEDGQVHDIDTLDLVELSAVDASELFTITVSVDGVQVIADWGNGPETQVGCRELIINGVELVDDYVSGSLRWDADGTSARADFTTEDWDSEAGELVEVSHTEHFDLEPVRG